jgi:hypothetical protein
VVLTLESGISLLVALFPVKKSQKSQKSQKVASKLSIVLNREGMNIGNFH